MLEPDTSGTIFSPERGNKEILDRDGCRLVKDKSRLISRSESKKLDKLLCVC